jgi:hypothetical protein
VTIEEYTKKLSELTQEAVNEVRDGIYVQNGNLLLATIKNRIQREGKDSSGAKMEGYSTKSAYYTRSQFVKKGSFKARGKTGKKVFANGDNHKSMFLQNGFKEFREIQGRQTQLRDLTLSGDLMLSYVLGTDTNAILLGFNQTFQSKKRKGNEKRNGGAIFSAMDSEMKAFNEGIIIAEKEIIKKTFE